MKRVDLWPEELAAYIESVRDRRFEWGQHDCAMFAFNAVKAMTGVDVAEDLRGTYTTEMGSKRAILRHGDDFASAVANVLGVSEVQPSLAQRGDVVMIDDDGKSALGIVNLCGGLSTVGQAGMVMRRRECAVRAWRIG